MCMREQVDQALDKPFAEFGRAGRLGRARHETPKYPAPATPRQTIPYLY